LQTDTLSVAIVHVEQVGWPDDSMKRVHHILAHEAEWETSDFVINLDSDLVFRGDVCDEFLVPSFSVWGVYAWQRPKDVWPLESRIESYAYVDAEQALAYYRGGLWGGSQGEFKLYATEIRKITDMDLNQDPPVVPIWHDESILNRVFFERQPHSTLSPWYMYPEPPHHLWLATTFKENWVSPDRKTRLKEIKIAEMIKENSQVRMNFPSDFENNNDDITHLHVIDLVTIVIPHFNRRGCLERLLASLTHLYIGICIIFVDSSWEHNDEYYLRDDEHLTVVRMESDIGVSAMRNAGARLAKTPYVLFLDDDTLLLPNTRLELMLHALIKGRLDGVGGHLTEKQHDDLNPSQFAYELGSANGWMLNRNGTTLTQTDAVIFEKGHTTLSTMAVKDEQSVIIPNCYHADMVENVLLIRTDSFVRDGGLFWDDSLKLGEHEEFFLRGAAMNRRFAFCHGFGFIFGNDHGRNCLDTRMFAGYKKDRKRQFSQWVGLFQKYELNKLVTPASTYSLSCGSYQDIAANPSCTVFPEDQWDIWYENEMIPEDAPSQLSMKHFDLSEHEATKPASGNGRFATKMLMEPGSFVEVSRKELMQFSGKSPFSVDFWVLPTSQTRVRRQQLLGGQQTGAVLCWCTRGSCQLCSQHGTW
jgi:glycosyltransferase involved in cell wall biosynthesis